MKSHNLLCEKKSDPSQNETKCESSLNSQPEAKGAKTHTVKPPNFSKDIQIGAYKFAEKGPKAELEDFSSHDSGSVSSTSDNKNGENLPDEE